MRQKDIDGIEDLFQIEIVEGKRLYACNVCNEGFEKTNDIKKHIEKDHFQVLLQIRKEMYEEEDGSDTSLYIVSEYDEAFLVKFDDDGNLIE